MSITDLNADTIATFDFEDLVGEEFDFYGIDGNCFRLDDTTYEVVERDDGSFEVIISKDRIAGMPIARVIIEADDHAYEIIDLHDDHCWLAFGSFSRCIVTDEFYFDYSPKGSE